VLSRRNRGLRSDTSAPAIEDGTLLELALLDSEMNHQGRRDNWRASSWAPFAQPSQIPAPSAGPQRGSGFRSKRAGSDPKKDMRIAVRTPFAVPELKRHARTTTATSGIDSPCTRFGLQRVRRPWAATCAAHLDSRTMIRCRCRPRGRHGSSRAGSDLRRVG
jgi:hypothetical protein